ncbi:MAG: hypothetical protein GVY26_09255 [Bacteroidetes bacterium]|jgi:hypothetical protein|nr:hypothetical protein [Bacteroidota bacterium]
MKTLPLMMCALASLLLSNDLMGQERVYDLSNYKARYELRPGMRLYGGSDFEGDYAREDKAFQNFRLNSSVSWFMNRITDNRISFWNMNSQMSFFTGPIGNSRFNQGDNRTVLSNRVSISSRRDNFYKPRKFWGWSNNTRLTDYRSSQDEGYRYNTLFVNGSLYLGSGRIEFAEDALLANWMLEDLQTAGITSNYTAEDVEALALTITDIIGNRVFDFRRRRIYELEQLQKTLLNRGVTQEETFQLFAILNDNWAFANRATLTHGNRFSYGLSTNSFGNIERWLETDFTDRNLNLELGGFAEYTRSRIINNNGSVSLSAGLQLDHYIRLSKRNGEDTENDREGWSGNLFVSYERTWLPNSRTEFSWINTFSVNRILQTNVGFDFSEFLNRERLSSRLQMDYFINYQWSFVARVGFNLQHERSSDQLRFEPYFSFDTNYFFF